MRKRRMENPGIGMSNEDSQGFEAFQYDPVDAEEEDTIPDVNVLNAMIAEQQAIEEQQET